MQNTKYYDNYNFDYRESRYFRFQEKNYGMILDCYYRNNELIEKEEYEKAKNELFLAVEERKKYYVSNYEYLMENNYAFASISLSMSKKRELGLRVQSKYDKWYLIVEKEKMVIFNPDTYLKIPKEECTIYKVNEECKGAVILEIKDVKKFIKMLEGEYHLEISFKNVVGVKYTQEVKIKEKVDLSVLDLDYSYDFEKIDWNEVNRIEINERVLDELEKQKEGLYYLSVEKGILEIIKSGEKKTLKIEIEDKEAVMKAKRVSIGKMRVKFNKDEKVYLSEREKELVLTNTKQYQVYNILELEEEEEED